MQDIFLQRSRLLALNAFWSSNFDDQHQPAHSTMDGVEQKSDINNLSQNALKNYFFENYSSLVI